MPVLYSIILAFAVFIVSSCGKSKYDISKAHKITNSTLDSSLQEDQSLISDGVIITSAPNVSSLTPKKILGIKIYNHKFVISNSIIFYSSSNIVKAFNIVTQDKVWAARLDGVTKSNYISSISITEDKKTIVVTTKYGSVYAINASTGSIIWQISLNDILNSQVTSIGSRIFLYSGSGKTYALEEESGKTLWIYGAIDSDDIAISSSASPLAASTKFLISYSASGSLDILDTNSGGRISSIDLRNSFSVDSVFTAFGITRNPVFHGRTNIISIPLNNQISLVHLGRGIKMKDFSIVSRAMAGADNYLFILDSNDNIYAISTLTFKVKWSKVSRGGAAKYTDIFIVNDLIGAINKNKKSIEYYDVNTGKLRQSVPVGSSIEMAYTFGSAIYFSAKNGSLFVIE